MKLSNSEVEKFIEKRREPHKIGQLRRAKMIAMRVGERRAPDENLPGNEKSVREALKEA